jgi:hypothetical protein
MFAPKVTKPQTKTSAVEQALFQRNTIGDQAVQRLNSRRTESEPKRQDEKQADQVSAALGITSDLSWDFSKIPIYPPNRPNGRQTGLPLATSVIQTKLEVGSVNDPLEHEADRIADQVLMTPSRAGISAAPPTIQRFSEQANEQINGAPASVERALSVSGRPLEEPLRHDMEQRFGYDFSGVRVHSGAAAAQSARDVNAHAYTVGQNLVFGAGRFAPRTQDGVKLLAHELAHVVQGAKQNGILRRAPDPKGLQAADEARLRVTIVEGLNARKASAVDATASAIERGDRAYLEDLGLTSKQVDILLNNPDTPVFKMTFGTAVELALEKAIRFDPFLNQYLKRGPVGRVPSGVGKPDWRIETPSSSIPVDLMTPEQVEKKIEMWRKQWKRGKPKWYIEKGLNTTYERPKPKRPIDAHQGTSMPQRKPPMDVQQGGMPQRTSPMDVHQGEMPQRTSPMDVHQGEMPQRTSPMDVHQGGMPQRTSPMDVQQGGMPQRTSPMDVHQGGMPQRTSPMDVHQGGMPQRAPPMDVHQGGMPALTAEPRPPSPGVAVGEIAIFVAPIVLDLVIGHLRHKLAESERDNIKMGWSALVAPEVEKAIQSVHQGWANNPETRPTEKTYLVVVYGITFEYQPHTRFWMPGGPVYLYKESTYLRSHTSTTPLNVRLYPPEKSTASESLGEVPERQVFAVSIPVWPEPPSAIR